MTMSDPIADMLTRIRNANTAKHDTVDIPASKMKVAIADILVKEGYVKKYDIEEVESFKTIHITLKYGKDKYRVTLVCHSSAKELIHPRTKKKVEELVNSIDQPVYCSECGLPLYNCTCKIDSE